MSAIDLKEGILPISAAASQLARRLIQAKETNTPIIITQKGYPSGVILSVDAYLKLKAAAEAHTKRATSHDLEAGDDA